MTNKDVVEMFENTLTGGFICVNTGLGFDTEIILPNHLQVDFNKMNINESFKAFKKQDLKSAYKLKLDGENSYSDRRVISKSLKLDENNQYSHVMTRPLPTGCIKKQGSILSWKKISLMLETMNLDGTIDHLFVVDTRLNFNKSNAKILMYNEISCPIFEKQKTIDATGRSVFQLRYYATFNF